MLINELPEYNYHDNKHREPALAYHIGGLGNHEHEMNYHIVNLDQIQSARKIIANDNQTELQSDQDIINARTEINNANTKFIKEYLVLNKLLEDSKDKMRACKSLEEARKLWTTDDNAIAACTAMQEAMDEWEKAEKTAKKVFDDGYPSVEEASCRNNKKQRCYFNKSCIRRARVDGTPLPEDEQLTKANIPLRDGCMTEYTEEQDDELAAS